MNNTPISNTPTSTPAPAQDPNTFSDSISKAETADKANIANATRPLDVPLIPEKGVTVQTEVMADIRTIKTQTQVQVTTNKLNITSSYQHDARINPSGHVHGDGPQGISTSVDYRLSERTATGIGVRHTLRENDLPWIKHKPTYVEMHATHTGSDHIVRGEVYIDPKLDHGVRFSSANTDQSGPRYQVNGILSRDRNVTKIASGPSFGTIKPPTQDGRSVHLETHHTLEAAVDIPIAGYVRLGAIGRIEGQREADHTTYTDSGESSSSTKLTSTTQYGAYLESGFLPEDQTVVRVSVTLAQETSSRHRRPFNTPDFSEYGAPKESLQIEISAQGHNKNGTVSYSAGMGVDTRLADIQHGAILTPGVTGNNKASVSGFTPVDAMYAKVQITAHLGGSHAAKPGEDGKFGGY